MSEYVFLYRNAPDSARPSPKEMQERMQTWMAWMQELGDKGHIKDRGQPLDSGGKVVRDFGKSITDGPYPEAKDVVLGYTLIEAKDLAQAAELARNCPIFHGGGAVEVRPVMSM